MNDKTFLGVEFGSTRIKAVAINESHRPISGGDYTWESRYENGVWTYSLDEVWIGLKTEQFNWTRSSEYCICSADAGETGSRRRTGRGTGLCCCINGWSRAALNGQGRRMRYSL